MRQFLLGQVFEYLDTDLKRFMDKSGKGPKYPLAPKLIKVKLLDLRMQQRRLLL